MSLFVLIESTLTKWCLLESDEFNPDKVSAQNKDSPGREGHPLRMLGAFVLFPPPSKIYTHSFRHFFPIANLKEEASQQRDRCRQTEPVCPFLMEMIQQITGDFREPSPKKLMAGGIRRY